MLNKKDIFNKNHGGYALITALIFFLAASTAVIAGLSDSVLREVHVMRIESASKQSYFASESALEDALYRLKKGKQIGVTETLTIASSTSSVIINTLSDNTKNIRSSADQDTTQRNTEAVLNTGVLAVFNYGLQAGIGGIDLGADVDGDIYTTGSIRGASTPTVSGMAIAAGKSSSSLDTDNSQPLPPNQSITFGNSSVTQDVSERFTVSSSNSITELKIFVKKTGSPANANVYIVNDSGSPDGTPGSTVISQGTLSSTNVGVGYDWLTIMLDSNPILTAGTPYWIVVDAETNSSGYYIIAANSGFAGGKANVGNFGNKIWFETSPEGLNSYFKLSIGSTQSGISGQNKNSLMTVGSAYAYKVEDVTSTGPIYCQSGVDNNKECDKTRSDPAILPYPVTDSMISSLRADASSGGIDIGSVQVGSDGLILGPRKIVGDLSVSGGGVLQVSGTVWITGNLSMVGGSSIAPADASHSYVVLVDGKINISGGSVVSDAIGNRIMLISMSNSDSAVSVGGGSAPTIIFAPYGGVSLDGGSTANSIVANHISTSGGSKVKYVPDMSQLNFSGGTSGGIGIKSWKEVE